jgi:hypothetical protein
VKSKSIILTSGCEIIALKSLDSLKKMELMTVSKKRTSMKDCYKCVMPNIVLKVMRHSI